MLNLFSSDIPDRAILDHSWWFDQILTFYFLTILFNFRMRKSLLLLAGIMITATLFYSCQQDNATAPEVSKAVLDQIWKLGYSIEDVQKIEEGYLVERDIILTEEDLLGQGDYLTLRVAETEQYRTTNQVTGLPRTITVSMDNQLAALNGYSAAVTECIARYNAESLQLTFQFVGSSGGQIHFKKQAGNFLASAGFPSGGNPYPLIKLNSNQIGSGSTTTFINFCASIMAHEMGHCIGLRHTDYYNRAISCGGAPSNEGSAGVGAILIPGTPGTATNAANSWMLACVSINQNRPFNADDQIALDYLY